MRDADRNGRNQTGKHSTLTGGAWYGGRDISPKLDRLHPDRRGVVRSLPKQARSCTKITVKKIVPKPLTNEKRNDIIETSK